MDINCKTCEHRKKHYSATPCIDCDEVDAFGNWERRKTTLKEAKKILNYHGPVFQKISKRNIDYHGYY